MGAERTWGAFETETSDGVVGVVCEKRVGWEFTLRASEMQVGLEGLVLLDWWLEIKDIWSGLFSKSELGDEREEREWRPLEPKAEGKGGKKGGNGRCLACAAKEAASRLKNGLWAWGGKLR